MHTIKAFIVVLSLLTICNAHASLKNSSVARWDFKTELTTIQSQVNPSLNALEAEHLKRLTQESATTAVEQYKTARKNARFWRSATLYITGIPIGIALYATYFLYRH